MAKSDEKKAEDKAAVELAAARLKLGKRIHRALRDDHTLTAEQLAELLDEPEHEIVHVLETHRVDDGEVVHAGPNAGGDWITP